MFNLQLIIGKVVDAPELYGEVFPEEYDFEEEYEAEKGGEYTSFKVESWHFEANQDNKNTKYVMPHHIDILDSDRAKKCVSELKRGDLVFVAGKRRESNWLENGVRRTRSFIKADTVERLDAGTIDSLNFKKYIYNYIKGLESNHEG